MSLRAAYAPWAGLFLGALAWFLHHQLVSNVTYWECSRGGPWLTGGLGLVFALIAGLGGVVSWRARAAPDGPRSGPFAVWVSAGSAAIFAFAILLQALSGFIIPGCFR